MTTEKLITTDYDRSIHSNPDAKAWAKFYCETFPGADEGLMIGWFANAMMAMHDHIKQTQPTAEQEREAIVEWLNAQAKIYNFSDQRSLVKDLAYRIKNGEFGLIDSETK